MGLRLAVALWSVVSLVHASERTPVTAVRPAARSAARSASLDASRRIAELVARATRLEADGKLPEAAASAQEALSVALGSGQEPETLATLQLRAAPGCTRCAEWPAAQAVRGAVLALRVTLHGKDNWQTIDARVRV